MEVDLHKGERSLENRFRVHLLLGCRYGMKCRNGQEHGKYHIVGG